MLGRRGRWSGVLHARLRPWSRSVQPSRTVPQEGEHRLRADPSRVFEHVKVRGARWDYPRFCASGKLVVIRRLRRQDYLDVRAWDDGAGYPTAPRGDLRQERLGGAPTPPTLLDVGLVDEASEVATPVGASSRRSRMRFVRCRAATRRSELAFPEIHIGGTAPALIVSSGPERTKGAAKLDIGSVVTHPSTLSAVFVNGRVLDAANSRRRPFR
jgi:hypothetical protein